VLIDGNHDRRFMAKNDEQRGKWEQIYLDAGFSRIYPNLVLYNFDGLPTVNLSHFPYEGDSHDGDRFESKRFEDKGIPLLHGHTHSSGDPVSWSTKRRNTVVDKETGDTFEHVLRTIQIHVGMDAWDFTPVPATKIAEILAENSLQAA
jgi:calcineurin-like phosphoesterase family protein